MLTLKPASANIPTLVKEIHRLLVEAESNEEFLVFARDIIANSPYLGNDQLKTVMEYVRANVRYQSDPAGAELLTSPYRMMILVKSGSAYGDCDDVAIICTAICRALGYDAHVILLDQTGNGYNHAATEVFSDETNLMYYMDPTYDENPLGTASSKTSNEPGHRFTPGYVKKLVIK